MQNAARFCCIGQDVKIGFARRSITRDGNINDTTILGNLLHLWDDSLFDNVSRNISSASGCLSSQSRKSDRETNWQLKNKSFEIVRHRCFDLQKTRTSFKFLPTVTGRKGIRIHRHDAGTTWWFWFHWLWHQFRDVGMLHLMAKAGIQESLKCMIIRKRHGHGACNLWYGLVLMSSEPSKTYCRQGTADSSSMLPTKKDISRYSQGHKTP